MSSNDSPVLYVKEGCPWCIDAERFLGEKGIAFERREVRSNRAYMEEMQALSGQSLTPTMKIGDALLADFGVDELIPFLKSLKLL